MWREDLMNSEHYTFKIPHLTLRKMRRDEQSPSIIELMRENSMARIHA
mgnify:CR=1 FL=1